jgi:hypothetical protein
MNNPEPIHYSLPENDSELRFILFKTGKLTLLTIGLNPSTANAYKHDGTSGNVEKIAKANGYDGWAMFNISPKRTPHPSDLPLEENQEIHINNIHYLDSFLSHKDNNVSDILLAWGNLENYFSHPYLIKYAALILDRLESHELNYWCIKLTKNGHPFHPSQQSINRYIGPIEKIKLKPFETHGYMNRLKLMAKIPR